MEGATGQGWEGGVGGVLLSNPMKGRAGPVLSQTVTWKAELVTLNFNILCVKENVHPSHPCVGVRVQL